MEILTLLWANIRKKKGAFISIFLLMTIITTVAMAIFSVRDNYEKGLADAFKAADSPDTTVMLAASALTDELRAKLADSALVERVSYRETLNTNGAYVGEMSDGNSWFMGLMQEGVRLYNGELNGFEHEIPPLREGEIYLPLGLKAKLSCEVGDTLTVNMIFGVKADFTIKGFVEEPAFGSMTIGWKQVFISAEDYKRIYEECEPLKTEAVILQTVAVSIYQSEESGLSPAIFQRRLNLETGIIDAAIGALNREQSERYSTIMSDTVMNIIMVFVAFLFVIVLIVMGNSLGTEIETDYVTLGILKSQGFGSGRIKLLFLLQYMLAQVAGVIVGGIAAIPIERVLSFACQSITAVLPAAGLSAQKSVLYALAIFLCSALIIAVKTNKVAKISPVRAISGGRPQVYFDSRFNAPIAQRTLSASLAFRQFTSNKLRYAGIIAIAAILTFFMITVNLLGDLMSSRKALNAMGMKDTDIEVYFRNEEAAEYLSDVDGIVRSHSEIEESNRETTRYVSINGESLYCEIFEDPALIPGIIKGREPKYDNEIMITEMVGKVLDLKMGHKVRISESDGEIECVISGIFQGGGDSGMAFATNFDVAKRLGIRVDYAMKYYIIDDKSKAFEIAGEILEKYGDFFNINVYDENTNPIQQEYGVIVDLLKIIIYAFSALFVFVAIRMACSRTFIQERRDIGIYKAIGFTSRRLRLGFALRFLIMSFIGGVIGTALSILFSARAVGATLSVIGISRVVLEFTPFSLIVPIIVTAVSYFAFAYMTSGRVRRVEVKELVAE